MFSGPGIFTVGKVSQHLFYDDKSQRSTVGLRASYYFFGVDQHTPYVVAFGKYSKSKVTSTPNTIAITILNDPERTGNFTETSGGIAGGFQWVLKAFTFNVGLGFAYFNHPNTIRLAAADGSKAYNFDLPQDKTSVVLDGGVGFRF